MNSPTLILQCRAIEARRTVPTAAVSESLCRAVGDSLTDAERERHIASCGYLMLQAYKRYEVSSCFTDRAESDRWRLLMEAAIQARSAAMVAKLEAGRGLA